jgi:hypothetical protein
MKFVRPPFLCGIWLSKRHSVASSVLKYFFAAVFVWGLTGCAHVELASASVGMPQGQPQRLMVILTVPYRWKDGIKDFSSSFTDGVQACGSQASIFLIETKPEDLSLRDEAAEKRRQLLNEEANFSPDGVLFVWNTGYASSSSYGLTGLQFEFSYTHVSVDKSGRPSWHGKATVPSGLGSDFATAILESMKKYDILQKCPATDE